MESVNGPDPMAVNDHRDGAAEKTNGDHQAPLLANLDEQAFDPRQWTFFQAHLLADGKEWPRLGEQSRSDGGLNRVDLLRVHGNRGSPDTDEMQDVRDHQQRKAVFHPQAGKDVAGE